MSTNGQKKLNKRILIIEDEPSLLRLLEDKFNNEGFITLAAGDGAEGLEIAMRDMPDIILLDLLIPLVSGLDLMKKVREAGGWGKRVPIIILTNVTLDDKMLREISRNEPSYYLEKRDWKIESVVRKVKECLGLASGQEDPSVEYRLEIPSSRQKKST